MTTFFSKTLKSRYINTARNFKSKGQFFIEKTIQLTSWTNLEPSFTSFKHVEWFRLSFIGRWLFEYFCSFKSWWDFDSMRLKFLFGLKFSGLTDILTEASSLVDPSFRNLKRNWTTRPEWFLVNSHLNFPGEDNGKINSDSTIKAFNKRKKWRTHANYCEQFTTWENLPQALNTAFKNFKMTNDCFLGAFKIENKNKKNIFVE